MAIGSVSVFKDDHSKLKYSFYSYGRHADADLAHFEYLRDHVKTFSIHSLVYVTLLQIMDVERKIKENHIRDSNIILTHVVVTLMFVSYCGI